MSTGGMMPNHQGDVVVGLFCNKLSCRCHAFASDVPDYLRPQGAIGPQGVGPLAQPLSAEAQLGISPLNSGSANPKTLTGQTKVPNLSIVPFTGIIHEARAMEYGAFHAPRVDGKKGYGPFNWREHKIEYMTYLEAAIRHLASAADREDIDPDTGDLKVWHLDLAKATIGILIDALEHDCVIDNRSPTAKGRVAALLREKRKPL